MNNPKSPRVQRDVLNMLAVSDKQPRMYLFYIMNQTFEFLKHQAANVWYLYMINDLNDESIIKKLIRLVFC